MKFLDFILSFLKKTKEQRIKKLALKLVSEMDIYCTGNDGVNNINVWFDWDMHPKMEIEVSFKTLRLEIKTNSKNTNYKNI